VCQPFTDLGLDPINGIGSLVEHSLLVGDDTSDSPRFRMLETIREFSVRKLRESSEEATIRHRHMESFAELIEKAHPNLEGPDSAEWMEVLGRENANLQAAFTYAVETSNADIAQRIVAAAWRFWQSRGHLVEGTEAATKALALDGGSGPVRAAALDAAGSIAYWTGDRVACRSFYEQAVEIRREGDDKASLLNALYNLSFPVSDEDGLEAATALLDEAIVIAEEIGDERMLGMIFTALARTWLHASPADSQRYAEKAIEAGENIGDPIFVAWATSLVGGSQQMMGDSLAAVATFQRGLRTFHEHGDLSGIAVDITGLADIARHVGDDTSALYFVGAVTRIREDSGIGVQTALDGTLTEFSTPESIAALSPDLAAAYESGRSEPMNAAVARALEWNLA
jgi:tetratricopeptide (TPR) repeat protein